MCVLRGNMWRWLCAWAIFLKSYGIQKRNKNFTRSVSLWYPVLHEQSYYADIDPVYLYQNAWCAGKVFESSPKQHIDVASSLQFVSMIGQYLPVTFIDIHNPELSFYGVSYQKGDVCELPFADSSVVSLSSLCVIEHIGLGRYGDTLDAFGSESAAHELSRVIAPGGHLYISVPVDEGNRIYHNAHRAFTREYIVKELFRNLKLVSEQYIYGRKMESSYVSSKGFGTGLFEFTKP